jgi:hypothetical protein
MAFPVFEKKEDIPKGFEDDYEEREGKFHPKVPDVTKQQTALETERTNAENERKRANKAEKDLADLKRKQQAADNNISEEQLEGLRKEDAEKRKPLEDENAKLKLELTKVKKTDRVQSLALKSGIMQDRIEDAMLLLEKRTGLTDNGDTITVLDKDGKLTTTSIDQFLKTDFKKEKPWLYAGSGASGSGATGSIGSGDDTEQRPAPDKKQLDQKRAVVSAAF